MISRDYLVRRLREQEAQMDKLRAKDATSHVQSNINYVRGTIVTLKQLLLEFDIQGART